MLERIFPKRIDNTFSGHRLAIWLLVPVIVVKGGMGGNSLFNTRVVATSADGIPVDSYGAAGAEAVLAFFALWGLFTLFLAIEGALVLVRWRTLIPFAYLLFLVEHLTRKAIFLIHPVATAGAQQTGLAGLSVGAAINYGLLGLLAIGFVLSLLPRQAPAVAEGAG